MISTLISVDWTHGLTSNEGDAPEGRAAPSKTKIEKTMDPIFTVCLSAPSLCVCLSVFLCLPLSSFVSLFVFISVSVSLFVTDPRTACLRGSQLLCHPDPQQPREARVVRAEASDQESERT